MGARGSQIFVIAGLSFGGAWALGPGSLSAQESDPEQPEETETGSEEQGETTAPVEGQAAPVPTEAESANIQAAAAAYQEAQEAQLLGEYGRAAELFELANRAAPSPEALRSAIRNHNEAGQLARAGTLSLEALALYQDEETLTLANAIVESAAARFARLQVRCSPACVLSIDGGALSAGDPRDAYALFLDPGDRELTARWPDRPEVRRPLRLLAGGDTRLTLRPPPGIPPGQSAASASDGAGTTADSGGISQLSPLWFGIAAGLTAVAAGLLVWSGVDTLSARDDYVADPTREGYDHGLSLEWRTNGFLIATAVLGATAAVLAILTDWTAGSDVEAAAMIVPEGAFASLRVRFGSSEREVAP